MKRVDDYRDSNKKYTKLRYVKPSKAEKAARKLSRLADEAVKRRLQEKAGETPTTPVESKMRKRYKKRSNPEPLKFRNVGDKGFTDPGFELDYQDTNLPYGQKRKLPVGDLPPRKLILTDEGDVLSVVKNPVPSRFIDSYSAELYSTYSPYAVAGYYMGGIDLASGGANTCCGGCHSLIPSGSNGTTRDSKTVNWSGLQVRFNVIWTGNSSVNGFPPTITNAPASRDLEVFVVIDNESRRGFSSYLLGSSITSMSNVYPWRSSMEYSNLMSDLNTLGDRFKCIKRFVIRCPNVTSITADATNINAAIPMTIAPCVTFGPSVPGTISSTGVISSLAAPEFHSFYIPLDIRQSWASDAGLYTDADKQLLVFFWSGGRGGVTTIGNMGADVVCQSRLYFK